MKAGMLSTAVALFGFMALASPAGACPNGYHAVWIQGNKVCRVNTPKLPLKRKENREPGAKSPALKSR